MRILMVMTSHDRLGHTRQKTGVWLEEFAAPYYVFKDADVELTLASPKGGKPPILIEVMWFEEKFVAAVCRGPGVFRHTNKPDGTPLVKAKSITGFANTEEEAVGLTHVVPFLVEEMLRANGGLFSKAENWHPHVVIDGNLVTGQNPASSEPAAKTLLHLMTRQQLSLMLGGAEPVPPFTMPP